jgi:hypothetical protein
MARPMPRPLLVRGNRRICLRKALKYVRQKSGLDADAVIDDEEFNLGFDRPDFDFDDERDTSEMLEFVFNDCGAIVQTAQSAEAALAIFDKWQPDMLGSDIGLPHIDGYELIGIIREERFVANVPEVTL